MPLVLPWMALTDVDWIFPNSIKAEREQAMYVDYVQDITEENGAYSWKNPHPSDLYARTYNTPASVSVACAICQIGASTPKGLAIIADIWRKFEPTSETSLEDLRDLKDRTMERLIEEGLCSATDPARQLVEDWPLSAVAAAENVGRAAQGTGKSRKFTPCPNGPYSLDSGNGGEERPTSGDLP